MDRTGHHEVGRHRIALVSRDGVVPVSPYSQLPAGNIVALTGQSVVDGGSGSDLLAMVATLRGAARIYLFDTFRAAISLRLENAEHDHVREGHTALPVGDNIISPPHGERIDVIVSNSATLPLPAPDRADSPVYARPEGGSIIEAIMQRSPHAGSQRRLKPHHHPFDKLST